MSEEDRIRESGQLTLGGSQKGRSICFRLLVRSRAMRIFPEVRKPQNMSMCCRNLLRWRTMGKSKASWR